MLSVKYTGQETRIMDKDLVLIVDDDHAVRTMLCKIMDSCRITPGSLPESVHRNMIPTTQITVPFCSSEFFSDHFSFSVQR